MKNILLNFLPIILIFLLVSYTNFFAKISTSILGKLFAIILIIFYTFTDKLVGLFVCLIIIYYYQNDFIESFELLNRNNINPKEKYLENVGKVENFDNLEKVSGEEKEKKGESNDTNNLLDLNKIEENQVLITDTTDSYKKTEKYCKNGFLMNKGQIVKNEMIEHVYPNIKIENEYHKCNICDPTCKFTFTNKIIETEENIMPKSSNDWVDIVWNNMKKTMQ